MRRVLYVIHYSVFGGPHNQALRLAAPLRQRGWETIVLLPDEPGNAADRLRAGGVEVVTMPLHRLRAGKDPRLAIALVAGMAPEVRAVRRLIRQRSIDLVQIGGLVNPHAAIAARMERVPVVWQLLDTRAPWPVAYASMAFVLPLADVVMSTGLSVAVSHPGGKSLTNRLVPFFPPVDVDLFRPRTEDRASVRAEWSIPPDSLVVGCVSNLNPQKGIVDLIRAFIFARSRVPDARLVLVGAEYATHTSYSADIRAAMAAGGLKEGDGVVFAGERRDVERQLSGFDVFAFAPIPRGEGISTCVLEAMATGLPVVTTAIAGLPEAIQNGVNGRLVPPGDPQALGSAIADLLADRIAAERMGDAARRRAVERFAVDACVDSHLTAYDFALTKRGRAHRQQSPESNMLDGLVVCPLCRGPLALEVAAYTCAACDHAYPVVDGIPVLLPDLALSDHDEIDHILGAHDHAGEADAHKAAQASHFDRSVVEEFEVSRPHGAPSLYRFFIYEKLRRATASIGPALVGATALTVCGGSGMDAEFLARSGARVVSSDISLGAARRTRERARRYGLDITPIVADIEHLPFVDGAFDLVLVHDGLHHLEKPETGLSEMTRLARRWISITEPARAAATAVAVRAGFALEREEAGNLVARLTPAQVVEAVRVAGFRPLVAQRYMMYYRHEPGAIFRALSRRWVFPVVRAGWQVANAIVGAAGNKMVVVAERSNFEDCAE
jgi:glycosyltransferase involved in cell wall biosynthesis/uncharacterized protein YbaR (Trm112 family)